MDKERQPGIRTIAIMLVDSRFTRYPEVGQSVQTDLRFEYTYSCFNEGKGQGELSLRTTGKNSENDTIAYEAEIKYVGIFQVEQNAENMMIDEFMKSYAPAHIFPYLREFLSSLSTRAGLPTIILPPLNIIALTRSNDLEEADTKSLTGNEHNIE